ncbi:hypothetical protein NQ318_021054, partial [Aromia moschata]
AGIDKLEQAVLEGQGKKLVGEYSADYKTRTFLKSIPSLMGWATVPSVAAPASSESWRAIGFHRFARSSDRL